MEYIYIYQLIYVLLLKANDAAKATEGSGEESKAAEVEGLEKQVQHYKEVLAQTVSYTCYRIV